MDERWTDRWIEDRLMDGLKVDGWTGGEGGWVEEQITDGCIDDWSTSIVYII